MTTELDRRAREYLKREFWGDPTHNYKFELSSMRIEEIFQAGWKACREGIVDDLMEEPDSYAHCGDRANFYRTFGDEPVRDYSKVEVDKAAIKAAQEDKNNFVKLAKNLDPMAIGFRTYEYNGIPIEVCNNPKQRVEQLRAQGVNAIDLEAELAKLQDPHDFAWVDATGEGA